LPYDTGAASWDPNNTEWSLEGLLTGPQSGVGRRVAWDAEGDGLYHATENSARTINEGTVFWCIGGEDLDTGEMFYWGVDLGEDSIAHGLRFLAECEMTIAHNGIGYDYPEAEKLYPWFKRCAKAWDTLVIAKLIWPAESLIGPDMQLGREGKMPGNLIKRHSLEAWGHRTGTFKGHYTGGFHEWKPSMAVYMMGDVKGLVALWRLCEKRMGWLPDTPEGVIVWPELTLEYENAVARIILEQEWSGVKFNLEKANKLSAELSNEKARIETRLKEVFLPWWQPLDDPEKGRTAGTTMRRQLTEFPMVTTRRWSAKTGKELKPSVGHPTELIEAGSTACRIVYTEFNPGSRDHLGMRLQAVYGWKPKKYGANLKPTVDETTLEEIPDAVMPAEIRQLLLDYFVVAKTLGTLSKGRRAWITMAAGPTKEHPWHKVGYIHGMMDTCGAVTRRGTHKHPNLSGCPSVKKEKLADGTEAVVKGLRGRYGWECRELFEADPGEEMTGVDASALELIDLGHYLYPFDEGAFSARVCDPKRDPHRDNAEIAGMLRQDAKTAIYLYVYGGSAWKLSLDLTVDPGEVPALLGYKGLPALLRSLDKRFGDGFAQRMDDNQKARLAKARQIIIKFEAGIDGIKKLKDNIVKVGERGWLKAFDGSRIVVRKAYSALNAVLQSAGAISCKLWMKLLHERMASLGYIYGKDWRQVLFIHDELQFTHKKGLGPIIIKAAEECMVLAGEMLNLRGRYRTEGKTALNWAQTH
jgi:DNA polymerase-1